jgi:hypothetical protein
MTIPSIKVRIRSDWFILVKPVSQSRLVVVNKNNVINQKAINCVAIETKAALDKEFLLDISKIRGALPNEAKIEIPATSMAAYDKLTKLR